MLTRLLLLLIRFYQRAISPLFGNHCRFYPSCSHYAAEALQTHGLMKGGYLGIWRIMRCGPWTHGGHDPVPDKSR